MAWDKPVRCMVGEDGKTVRVQCNARRTARLSLVAERGNHSREIDHTKPCDTVEPVDAYKRLAKDGAKMVQGIAEAPPGYARAAWDAPIR